MPSRTAVTRRTDLGDGRDVQTWFDRRTRSWVTQTLDASGNQIGDASYAGTQAGALYDHRAHVAEARRRAATPPEA